MKLTLFLTVAISIANSPTAGAGEDKFFDSDGVRIRYIEQGTGEPVVLVHGFGGSVDTWVRSGVFGKLAKNYRAIAIDCRGHGKSDKPRDPKRYGRNMCLDILRLLDHLEIKRAHVVGYSMGGSLTLQLATIKPERFLSATLGGTAGRYAYPEEKLAKAYETADWLKNTPVRKIVLRRLPEDNPIPSEEMLKKLEAEYLAKQDPKALAAVRYSYADQIVSKEEVAAIKVPFLSIVGTADLAIERVKNLKKAMPALKIITIEGATHAGRTWAGGHPKFLGSLVEFLKTNSVKE